MLADQFRASIEAAPRVRLATIGEVLWKAWGAGQLTDTEAEGLAVLIEAKKVIPAPEKPMQGRIGSRPQSSASMARRRSWAAAGRLPPALAAQFTLAEQAVLAVVTVEVSKRGTCALTVAHLAALAGVSESLVRNALREAEALGLVSIDRRRRTAWMNYPNVIQIVSKEWTSWLRLRTGASSYSPRVLKDKSGLALKRENIDSGNLLRQRQDRAEPKEGLSA